MSVLRLGVAVAAVLVSASAFARTVTSTELLELDTGVYTVDTGGTGDDGSASGTAECFRECHSEYSSCMGSATQDSENYCLGAYEDFRAGLIDRMHYEMIMETCYDMYGADTEVCSTVLSMCQMGCDAG